MRRRLIATLWLFCGGSYGATTVNAQWYDNYHNLAAIYSRLDEFAIAYPDLVQPITIGNSYEGRPIRGIKIAGTGATREVRPGILINGTQHAREWISPMTNMYAAEQLLTRYESDSTVQELLDGAEVYVIPVINPDGYEYTWSSPANRLWRKNRRPVGGGQVGVDLNRNWAVGWGLDSGSSSNPVLETYRGPSPFSEPETMAMRDFYLSHQNLVGNIDFHSYSQLILYPYGYTATMAPTDEALMVQLANEMALSMFAEHGISYVPESASDLYLASGISIDWAYGDQSVYAYTIELRPNSFNPGFELPPAQILPTVEEAFEAVLDLGAYTLQLASGDFNYDGNYNCSDINRLYGALRVGSNKYEFDVNGDGILDNSDIGGWLASAGDANSIGGAYLPGDANLDGDVDVDDFNVWNFNRFTSSTSWCSGDFNADGVVDVGDFHLWNEHKFQSPGSLVPEPTGTG